MPSEQDDGASEARARLLERAVVYFQNGELRETLDRFASKHAEAFRDAAAEEGKTGEHEHKLEYTILHKEYVDLFEGLLTTFVQQEGCTTAEFLSDCRDALEDKYCALFEEHRHHWFVEALLSSAEYDAFYANMVAHARALSRK